MSEKKLASILRDLVDETIPEDRRESFYDRIKDATKGDAAPKKTTAKKTTAKKSAPRKTTAPRRVVR